jgi:hypothetical protein
MVYLGRQRAFHRFRFFSAPAYSASTEPKTRSRQVLRVASRVSIPYSWGLCRCLVRQNAPGYLRNGNRGINAGLGVALWRGYPRFVPWLTQATDYHISISHSFDVLLLGQYSFVGRIGWVPPQDYWLDLRDFLASIAFHVFRLLALSVPIPGISLIACAAVREISQPIKLAQAFQSNVVSLARVGYKVPKCPNIRNCSNNLKGQLCLLIASNR